MTGYTVHTGSNDKFRSGWDRVFKSSRPTRVAATKDKSQAAKTSKPGKSPKK